MSFGHSLDGPLIIGRFLLPLLLTSILFLLLILLLDMVDHGSGMFSSACTCWQVLGLSSHDSCNGNCNHWLYFLEWFFGSVFH